MGVTEHGVMMQPKFKTLWHAYFPLPYGDLLHSHGKSSLLITTASINRPISIKQTKLAFQRLRVWCWFSVKNRSVLISAWSRDNQGISDTPRCQSCLPAPGCRADYGRCWPCSPEEMVKLGDYRCLRSLIQILCWCSKHFKPQRCNWGVYILICIYIYILVGGIPTPLKKIWKSVGMILPNIWKNKNMFQTTNQDTYIKHVCVLYPK